METPPLWKIWLEGLYTLVRRFFRPTDIKTYHKPVHFKWKCIQILITLCLNFENVAKNCNGIAINEIFSRHRKKGHVGGCPKMLPVFAKPTHRIYSSDYSSSNLSSVEPKNRISLKVLFSEKICLMINYDLQWHPQKCSVMHATQKQKSISFPKRKVWTRTTPGDKQHKALSWMFLCKEMHNDGIFAQEEMHGCSKNA